MKGWALSELEFDGGWMKGTRVSGVSSGRDVKGNPKYLERQSGGDGHHGQTQGWV